MFTTMCPPINEEAKLLMAARAAAEGSASSTARKSATLMSVTTHRSSSARRTSEPISLVPSVTTPATSSLQPPRLQRKSGVPQLPPLTCAPLGKPQRKMWSLPRNACLSTLKEGGVGVGRAGGSATSDHAAPKSMRVPLSSRMVSQRPPQTVLQELQGALAGAGVVFHPDMFGAPSLHCTKGDITFEAEVVRLAGLSVHGLRFQRLKGDALEYKALCTQLLEAVALDDASEGRHTKSAR